MTRKTGVRRRNPPAPTLPRGIAAALDRLPAGFAVFDRGLRLAYCNAQFRNLRGYPRRLCRAGTPISDLCRFHAVQGDYGPGDVEAQIRERLDQIAARKPHEVERPLANGRLLRVRYAPLAGGGLLVTYSDITVMRSVETSLRNSEARYALITEAATEGIYDWNIETNDLYVSPRLNELFGFESGELTSEDWYRRVHGDDKDKYRSALTRHFKQLEAHLHCEYRIKVKSRQYRWVLDHGVAVRNASGRAFRLVGSVSDISARKAVEAALRESEERYALAMEAVNESVYDWNVRSGEIFYSPRLYAVLGILPEQLRTPDDWLERIHPADLPRYNEAMRAHFKGDSERFVCEYRYRGGDGEWHWARQHGLALRDASGRAYRMAGSTGDITEQRETARALEEARSRLTEAIEAVSEGFALFDAEDRLVLCNNRFREFYAEVADLLIPGASFERLLRATISRDVIAGTEHQTEEWVAERLQRHRQPTGSHEYQLNDGRWLKISERRTGEGGIVGVYTDITALKQREAQLNELVDSLAVARDEAMQATQTKSRFLAGMSHELRTPLNAILGYTEMILDEVYGSAPEKIREALERVQRNGKHLLALINDVLDLSKIEAGQLRLSLTDYSLRDVVHAVFSAVEPLATAKDLAFRVEVAPNLPPARGDERRLTQVLLNLVGNAIKFTDQGQVMIAASAANGSLTVSVRDTGPGIAAADQAKIFEEFQQADSSATREKGGTGLGLSIAKRIIEMHGGRMWVESVPGKGSTFYFTLPVRVEAEAGQS